MPVGAKFLCFMASYDVSNLFTNNLLDATITIILDSLFSNHDSLFLGMTRELFKTFFSANIVKMIKFSFFAQKVSSGMGALRPNCLGG